MSRTITLEINTAEIPIVTRALAQHHRRRKPWWKRLAFELWGKKCYKWHMPTEKPKPLTIQEIEERSARGASRRTTTRKLEPLQQRTGDTEEIDLSEIQALR